VVSPGAQQAVSSAGHRAASRPAGSYLIHGLRIRSEFPLPGLLENRDGPCDAEVRFAAVGAPAAVHRDELKCFTALDGTFYCGENGLGRVKVRSGTEILVEPSEPSTDADMLRLLVLGFALPALLYQRGLMVLHASVVAINGGSVAFMGRSGAGKSTLAGSFLNGGDTIISDDIAVIDLAAGMPLVQPGAPQLKLWPASVAKLGCAADTLKPLVKDHDKLVWHKENAWSSKASPLIRVYELVTGTTTVVRALAEHEALVALVRHSFCAQLGMVHDRGSATFHFDQCTRVLQRVPVRMLSLKRDLDRLADALGAVYEDLSTTAQPAVPG